MITNHRFLGRFALAAILIILAAAPPCVLADKANGKKAKLIAKYDKNGNGIIDGEEMEALRKDFAKDPNGELKVYDTNKDGKLDDAEIAAIKPGKGSGGGKKADKDKDKKAKTDKPEKAPEQKPEEKKDEPKSK